MTNEEKEVNCPCGHTYQSKLTVNWCPKCGNRVFDTEKELRSHKFSTYYYTALSVVVISAMAYFFVELILIPILSLSSH